MLSLFNRKGAIRIKKSAKGISHLYKINKMREELPVPNKLFKMMMEQSIPLHKFLGIELLEMRKGYGKVRVPFREEVMGDIRIRRWHGGLLLLLWIQLEDLQRAHI